MCNMSETNGKKKDGEISNEDMETKENEDTKEANDDRQSSDSDTDMTGRESDFSSLSAEDSDIGSESDMDSIDSEDESKNESPSKELTVDKDKGDISEEQKYEEEEDEVVKAIRESKKKAKSDHPPDIEIDSWVTDVCFHPEEDLIAISSMDGYISLQRYSIEGNAVVKTLKHHKKTCRDIEFDEDGKLLYTAAKDLTIQIVDMDTLKVKTKYADAHEDPISNLHVIDEYCCASGDDDGTVKIWDQRRQKSVMSLKKMDDYIADMVTRDCKDYLVCSSGEGTITAFNLKTKRMEIQSEVYENEFNCLGVIRRQSKLVAGNCGGKLYFFNWGKFDYHNDVQKGHPASLNCMIPVTETLILTGCEDGVIRAVHVFPHRFFGVVGQHDPSVEKMDVSSNGSLIASCSYDQTVKFWNIKYLEEKDLLDRGKPLVYRGKKKKAMKQALLKEKEYHLQSSTVRNSTEFFADM